MKTESDEQYITLFCEGDGHLGINNYCRPRIVFSQKERDVLEYIASLYEGGHFHQNSGVWVLEYDGSSCTSLLRTFSRHAVSKHFTERLNKVLVLIGFPLTKQHPITVDGFVGFWDAEGSSNNNPALFLVQKDREILDITQQSFGGNTYFIPSQNIHKWSLNGDEARPLVHEILVRNHYPAKAERLRNNFEGPSHYELHKEAQHVRNTKRRQEHKLVSAYLKQHPEITERLITKGGE